MGDYKINFYGGTNYGMSKDSGSYFGHSTAVSEIGLATDARTANQIRATSEKINTGAKSIEVQMTMPDVADSIPLQHLQELNRLRKITGVDLTLHGPLVEPTGVGQSGWNEHARQQAENQIWGALKRGAEIIGGKKANENLVVTFHSSNGLPEPETKVMVEDDDGKKKEVVSNLAIIDERTGRLGYLPDYAPDYFKGEGEPNPQNALKDFNKRQWDTALDNVNLRASRAREVFDDISKGELLEGKGEDSEEKLEKFYKMSIENPQEYQKQIEIIKKEDKIGAKLLQSYVGNVTHAGAYMNEAYNEFRDLFNKAYYTAQRDGDDLQRKKLESLRDEIYPIAEKYGKDPSKVRELADEVSKGIRTLVNLEKKPQIFRPLQDFAVDKASDTFSNVAFKAYKEFGEKAPIISIENPPAGSGLNRAEDLAKLIEESRNKFKNKLIIEKKMSEDDAKNAAEKLIGATWDVGHINMIRKFGYDEKELKEQTKKIAPFVKNVHLSDNFGMEHTELPMGMGNVPMAAHQEELKKALKDKYKDIKKVVEVGNWYQHFQSTPFTETLSAFGSPIYSMKMAPYWNQAEGNNGGYFTGYGNTLPEGHFSTYGAGFSNLPSELGGQMSGRSRMSGNPME